jgi:hypothetical protein
MLQLRHWTSIFTLLGRSIGAPSGRVALVGRFPGLKPWAESCSPFRAKLCFLGHFEPYGRSQTVTGKFGTFYNNDQL